MKKLPFRRLRRLEREGMRGCLWERSKLPYERQKFHSKFNFVGEREKKKKIFLATGYDSFIEIPGPFDVADS